MSWAWSYRVLWTGVVLLLLVALLVITYQPEPITVNTASLDGMVLVPGGLVKMGAKEYQIEAFYMDRFEVTEAEWRAYESAMNRKPIDLWTMLRRDPDYPMRNLSFFDAKRFAHWRRKSLPTNRQYELASRGPGGESYPWGDAFLPAANTRDIWEGRMRRWGVTRVGTFERGRSTTGAYDLIGNVREWTLSPGAERDHRMVRGGSFSTSIRRRARLEESVNARSRSWDLGFRCVIGATEHKRQQKIRSSLVNLGYRWRWLHWDRTSAATRYLVSQGPFASPFVKEALETAGPAWLRARLQRLLDRIED